MASEFERLLAELKAADAPKQKLLIKADVMRQAREGAKNTPVSGQPLGELIKSAVSDAVASGRLSGTTAVAGLKALGLDDDGKTPIASMSGLSREQQRATVDHMVRLAKLTGSEAVELLEKIECGG